MTELLHPASHDPGAGPGRPGGTPEIHRLAMRETAVIAIDVAPDEIGPAVGAAIMEVEAAMRTAGVDLGGPPFARYLAFEPHIRAEIGFPVMRPAPDVGRVVPGRLPGGRVASIVHIGPYETLEGSYGELVRWLAEMGIHPAGPLWEVYWSDPDVEPDPATWRTEIFAPIEERLRRCGAVRRAGTHALATPRSAGTHAPCDAALRRARRSSRCLPRPPGDAGAHSPASPPR